MSVIHADVLGAGEAVVLIHGWGMHSGIWLDFARTLAVTHQVICLDLPGHGLSQPLLNASLSQQTQALLASIPVEKFSVVGWSLGGLLAIEMANSAPERVKSLVLLASNPCFVTQDYWPGVKREVLDSFARQLQADPQQTLMRFMALQVNGLSNAKMRLQQIKQAVLSRPAADLASLEQGLNTLKQEDMRKILANISCSVSAILAGRDTLVPISLQNTLPDIRKDIKIKVLPDAGHMPFLTHAEVLLDSLRESL